MNRRQASLVALLLAGGCLAPHYGVDATDSVDAGGSSGDGNGKRPTAGQADGGAESLGGAADPGTLEGGGPASETCEADQKRCGGQCVGISDVAYGCGASTCNQSSCPADFEAVLGCDGESCVAVDCTDGFKLCDARCVSESDPTFGCGPAACDDSACPDPGPGTLTCSDGACVVGDCATGSKQCGNKCVPKNEDNGCAAEACDACASNQVCAGAPAECACEATVDPCAGFECGSAVDSCGELKDCRNDCAGTKEPFCIGNTCRECKQASDCQAPDDNPCRKPACTNNSCTFTVAAPNTPCPGGGKCSATLPGVCERPPVKVGAFNIDATEVTRGQYDAFLKAKAGDMSGQIAACSWNATYTPTGGWPGYPYQIEYPISLVDWCDAHAYCKWAGRRLCGKLGGGSFDLTVDSTGAGSQWVNACLPAAGGPYPYGSPFNVDACNGKNTSGASEPVASYPECVGGEPGLYDMSGNMAEWNDGCTGYTDADDACVTLGGAFGSTNTGEYLVCSHGQGYRRDVTATWVGFRCCSNP
jgi:formylglycine-generating enzyme